MRLARLLRTVLQGNTLGFEVTRSLGRRVCRGLNRLDCGCVNENHTRLPQCSANCGQVVGGQGMAGKGFVDQFQGQTVSLGGEPQQFDYPLRDIETRLGLEELE